MVGQSEREELLVDLVKQELLDACLPTFVYCVCRIGSISSKSEEEYIGTVEVRVGVVVGG